MKHKFTFITSLIIILILSSITQAEIHPSTLKGAVLDATTRAPVISANVVVIDTDRGASSDLDGRFRITGLKPGTYHIEVSALGYSSLTRSEIAIMPGKSVELEFLLEPTVIKGEEVVVHSGFFMLSVDLPTSTRSFSYEEIRRAPGSAEDVQRAVQAMPGVYSRNDQNNEIVVRGGSPIENLTIIDGLEIDNINHFPDQSTSGGPISAVNPEFLEDVTFSTGGFSARYGDRLSSILDLELREGDPDIFTGQIGFSMAGAGLDLEGGLPGRNGSYIFSFRKSYLDLIHNAIGLTSIPNYWDVQFKLAHDITSRTHFSLMGLYGNDEIKIEAEDEDAWSRGAESFEAKGYNFALGGRLQMASRHGFTELILGRAEAYYSHDVFEVEKDENDITLKRIFYTNRSTETTDQLHIIQKFRAWNADELSFGIGLKPITFSHDMWMEQDTTVYDFDDDGANLDTIFRPEWRVDESTTAFKYGGFIQYRWRPRQNLSFIGGVRFDGFDYSEEFTVGPRLSMKWEFIPKLTANLAYGLYYQSLSLMNYTSDPDNHCLPHPRADHYVTGLTYLLSNSTQISCEGYFKDYRNLIVSERWLKRNVEETNRSFRSLPIAKKEAWGLEFFAQQKLAANWYGTLAYSYGESKKIIPAYTFDELDKTIPGVTFPADYDFRHVVTLVLGYNFSGLPVREFQRHWYGMWTNVLPINGDELTISTRYRYVSGRPYTSKVWTDAGPEVEYHWDASDDFNGTRYPDYSRWDVRWDSKWFFGRKSIIAFMEVQNVLDRANVAEYVYADDGDRNTVHQFRFFFVGGMRFEW